MDIEEIADGTSSDGHEATPTHPVEESGDQHGLDIPGYRTGDKPNYETGPGSKVDRSSTKELRERSQ